MSSMNSISQFPRIVKINCTIFIGNRKKDIRPPQGAGIPVLKEKIACDCGAMKFIKWAGANAAGNRSFFLVLLSSVESIGIAGRRRTISPACTWGTGAIH